MAEEGETQVTESDVVMDEEASVEPEDVPGREGDTQMEAVVEVSVNHRQSEV